MISSLLDLSYPANVHIQAFADDITLVVAGKTRLQIQTLANKTLHMIHTWSNQHHITFNPSKCNFILIGNHYLKRPPTIKLGNHNIRHTHELNILGIIFDHKLSFIPHTTYLRDKIYKHTIALSLFSGLHWGFSPKHFRALYTRSLERIITYGAPVFFQPTPNSHLIRKLISIQRIPLLKICKAFSTVSNASINILTNILPIEYTLNREIALFHIFQLKQPYTLHTNIQGNDIADYLANTSRHTGTPVNLFPNKQYIRKQIRQQQYILWNSKWRENHSTTPVFKWIPSVFTIPEYFPTSYLQTQILTDHGRFPYYFYRFHRSPHNICPCGQQADNFTHYTTTCTLTTQ
ncbi:hypothetical protein IscW_ISCW024929, partial [Ixodes scapularis]